MAGTDSHDDYLVHKKTFDSFTKLVKWAIIGTVIVMVALYFIVNP